MLAAEVLKRADANHMDVSRYKIAFNEVWEGLTAQCTPFRAPNSNAILDYKLILPDGTVLSKTKAGKLLDEQLLGRSQSWWNHDQLHAVRVRDTSGQSSPWRS